MPQASLLPGHASLTTSPSTYHQVVVCMIYYLDVHGRGSWADCFLQGMCYDCAPGRLQAAIKRVFELATSRIAIEGTEVVAFPLFEVRE